MGYNADATPPRVGCWGEQAQLCAGAGARAGGALWWWCKCRSGHARTLANHVLVVKAGGGGDEADCVLMLGPMLVKVGRASTHLYPSVPVAAVLIDQLLAL